MWEYYEICYKNKVLGFILSPVFIQTLKTTEAYFGR